MKKPTKEVLLHTKKLKPSEILKLCPSLLEFPLLTNRQKAFVYYYVSNGNNRRDAVIKAGYKTSKEGVDANRTYFVLANQNLHNIVIQKAIRKVLKDFIEIRKNTLEHNIFEKLMKVIELDVCDYLDDNGLVKGKLSDIPKEIRQMITKTEIKYYGKEAHIKVLSLEFLGKQWAYEKLMKYIDMIKDTPTNVNIVSEEVRINLMNMLNGKG